MRCGRIASPGGVGTGGKLKGENALPDAVLLLAVSVLGTLQRSADIWWFCVLHFTLDLTQFQA